MPLPETMRSPTFRQRFIGSTRWYTTDGRTEWAAAIGVAWLADGEAVFTVDLCVLR
jgi:hypothetical protein